MHVYHYVFSVVEDCDGTQLNTATTYNKQNKQAMAVKQIIHKYKT